MAWMQPKMDWESSYDSAGNYTGDYFNFTDYNRIKNNLTELRNKAVLLYPEFSLSSMGGQTKRQEITCMQMRLMLWRIIWMQSAKIPSQSWEG